jgi:ubiquinone/menaquinone biosynthesis C-methylase UbiE
MLRVFEWLRHRRQPAQEKGGGEFSYWQAKQSQEGTLTNDHFERYYTSHFGLSHDDYRGKRVLDIGCGPRGSLEWATMASERVGLDPLAERYQSLGTTKHGMRYVASPAENVPFADGYFDIVCSFNSLDHVDDLDRTCSEIIRVVKPAGLFLLLSDIHDEPTPCEPVVFSWDIVSKFTASMELDGERHYEKVPEGLYQSIDAATPYNHDNPEKRYGVLSAKFRKRGAAS